MNRGRFITIIYRCAFTQYKQNEMLFKRMAASLRSPKPIAEISLTHYA